MRRIIYSIGFFLIMLFLFAGFVFSYQMTALKDRICILEESSAKVEQKVSASVQSKDQNFIFERYEDGRWKRESYRITAYGAQRVVFRQEQPDKGDAVTAEQGFCLKVENGYVVVYEEGCNGVFEYTDIPFETLPQKLQSEVLLGKTVKNTDDLYDFLENYSS